MVQRRAYLSKKTAPEIIRFQGLWSEMGDSNSRHLAPKPMSEPSGRTESPSLALSGTPAVPLWNSIGLFISGTAFGFWDLCGIGFCVLKDVPPGLKRVMTGQSPQNRGAETAPHKQRNKRDDKETAG